MTMPSLRSNWIGGENLLGLFLSTRTSLPEQLCHVFYAGYYCWAITYRYADDLKVIKFGEFMEYLI